MYPKQLDAIFNPARIAVIEASTKSGKTTACLVWLLEQALQGKSGYHYWWIAPIFPQARIAFERMKLGLPPQLFTANETNLTITLFNGCIIDFKGADKPDSLYGQDVYAAVIDEATRTKPECWHAVRSTLTATRGQVRIIGNVKGKKNWAYLQARRAQDRTQTDPANLDMHYAKITAQDAVSAGVLDAQEIEDAREDLPDDVFRELYEAEPTEDGANPFGLSAIEKCTVRPPAMLLSPYPVVAWGVDLAKSNDWTVVIGLDGRGALAVYERWQGPWELTIAKVGGFLKQPALTRVDSTGVGDPIVERLQKECGEHVQGFVFTSGSKQQIMEGLAVAIQHQQITFPEGRIPDELKDFEYVYTKTGVRYTAPDGLHDDCVCALALAQSCLDFGDAPTEELVVVEMPVEISPY